MRALIASPVGFLIGLSLGALGGGGSVLAVPALVYLAGQDPKAATATSLALVALTALVGIVPHARAGRVRFGQGALFAATGVGGTLVGTRLNAAVEPDVLLLWFAGLMLLVAALMLRSTRRRPAPRAAGAAVAAMPTGPHSLPSTGWTAAAVLRLLAAGRPVIVPALVLALGFSMPNAVGTSMLVIVLNSLVALVARFGDGAIEPRVIVPFAIASISGVIVGSGLADRHEPRTLQRWFASLLIVVAVYTAVRSALAV